MEVKAIIITMEIKITDIEHLNIEEVTAAASQQGEATIIDIKVEKKNSKTY